MKFLEQPPRYLFFTGKGGAGKTSIACASAVELAARGRRVLLVSTDPASNVGQVFGLDIGNRITAIAAVPNLAALEIDPLAAAQAYRDRVVGPVRSILPEDVVKGIEEQLSGACTTEIAAFDEFTALLTDAELAQRYDHIVFDTAPTGHTIRLLRLPGAWSGFLEAGRGDASCLGPLAGLEKQRSRYRAAVDALADPLHTRLILVSRAQAAALREAARTHGELAAIGLRRQFLVINGCLPGEEAGRDDLGRSIAQRERRALADLPASLSDLPCDLIPLRPFNVVGADALRRFFADEPDGIPVDAATADASIAFGTRGLASLVDELAAGHCTLVMLMGKGGVGKTTLAAAIAVDLARRGHPVHLSTSDPAAHLAETLSGTIANLTLSRIDPRAETETYRAHVLATKGKDLDAEGRALLEEDLRSPCTEEIAVFQAFSRIVRDAGSRFVVMDTAPTGHTLMLLDATGAYHREIVRQAARSGDRRPATPMPRLRDPERTKVLIVTLAETTPVLEAAGLQADLRRAGIEPWAWVVNNSLAAAEPHSGFTSSLLETRANGERREIATVATRHARRYAVVPMRESDPVGVDGLLRLVHHGAAAGEEGSAIDERAM